MLKATKKLHELLILDKSNYKIEFYVDFIVEKGSKKDLDFLFPYALKEIEYFNYIFSIIMTFGEEYHAKKLYENYTENDRLKYENSELLLHCFGYLGYQKSIGMLMYYLDGSNSGNDEYLTYDAMVKSAFGLLSLDCSEYKKEIEDKIFSYKGKGIFNEFMPALACKTDNKDILGFLYELGSEASTDCLNGIVLGISLFGKKGKEFFDKIIFNPSWEIADGGTGIARYLHLALKIQNYSIVEILDMFKVIISNEKNDFNTISEVFEIMITVLESFIYNYSKQIFIKGIKEYKIDYIDMYKTIFMESGVDAEDSITDLYYKYLKERFEDKAIHYKPQKDYSSTIEREKDEEEARELMRDYNQGILETLWHLDDVLSQKFKYLTKKSIKKEEK